MRSIPRPLFRLLIIFGLLGTTISTLLGGVGWSQVNASDQPQKTFLPLLSKPAISTVFGAFMDSYPLDNGTATMITAGMTWIHIPFSWSSLEPKPGARKWNSAKDIDAELHLASRNYLNTIIYINDVPGWALKAGYIGCGPVSQDKFPDMVNFLTDLVTRYSAPPFNVKYYELWSEEDAFGTLGCWGDPSDLNYYGGGYYGEMLKVAYPAIKAANPQAQVLFGGLLMDCDPNNVAGCGGDPTVKKQIGSFLKGALEDGAGPYFDGISFHAYDYYWGLGNYSNPNWGSAWNTTGPSALAKAAYLRGLLAQYNLTGKYLMNTEAALLCGRTGQEPPCVTADHTTTVSSYIIQVYATGIANGLRGVFWFSTDGWRGSQLLTSDQSPLPPFGAYVEARSWLGEAVFTRTITQYIGVKGYEFSQKGSRIWVLWSAAEAGQSFNIDLGQVPSAVYDMYGNLVPSAANPLNIGQNPVFVVFKP